VRKENKKREKEVIYGRAESQEKSQEEKKNGYNALVQGRTRE
jgi:hypothetical protein